MRKSNTLCILAALSVAALVAAAPAVAAPITIENAGFQDLFTDDTETTPMLIGDGTSPAENQFDDNEFSASFGDTQFRDRQGDDDWSPIFIPDWRPLGSPTATSFTGVGVINQTSTVNTLFNDTDNVAGVLFGNDMFNDLSATLEAGTYTLSALVGDRSDTSFAGGDLILQADVTTLAPDSESNAAPSNGGFTTWTDTITIGLGDSRIGQSLTVGFTFGGPGGQTLVDDFSLDSAPTVISTPAALPAALGLFAFTALRRRRRA